MGARGAVAAGHPATAEAAATILDEGGNAFDAALAAMVAACVTEPVFCSMGGGGFLLAHDADGTTELCDFFAQTPLARPDERHSHFYPVLCDFGTVQQEFHIGMASIATPGVVKGLFEVGRRLGRMPLKRVVEPALHLAKQGVALHRLQAYIFQVVGPIYMETAGSRAIFESKERPGELIGEGELVANPDFADFLDALVSEGEDLFYRGEIAARVDAECRAAGGTLRRADFEAFRMERRRPLSLDYGGATLFTNPPPSAGGILIAFALEMLKEIRAGFRSFGAAEHLGPLVRVMDLTNEARVESRLHEGEPDAAAARLFSAPLLETYRARVAGQPRARRGTTHISVVDADGNAASLTISNGEGCGYVIPGTGVMLNNMLGEEDINPHGFHAWPTDRRLSSMMAPSLIVDSDGRLTALGSGGSNRLRTAILQVLINLIDFGLDMEAAVENPRVHFERGLLNIEPGFPEDAVRALVSDYPEHKLWDDRNLFFGGVHAVRADRDSGNFAGAGDPRRGGAAVNL